MKQIVARAIVLSRTDYGEADRILTLLTPDHGKLRLLAKGVRRVKSKLAGGIELFSVSTITFVKGKGEIGTLVSTRLETHYQYIVQDLERTMLGYELIKVLNKLTEDAPGPEYFEFLREVFVALDDAAVSTPLIQCWFAAQLLRLGGHSPNLRTDGAGQKLQSGIRYDFNFEKMSFVLSEQGRYNTHQIKFLRLAFAPTATARMLSQVQGVRSLLDDCLMLLRQMRQHL